MYKYKRRFYLPAFIIGVLSFNITDTQVRGPLCYSCQHMPHQRDCATITQCGQHEVCYGQKYLTNDGMTLYRSGCKGINQCLVITKRDDTRTLCDRCCHGDYCNLQSCDTQIKSWPRLNVVTVAGYYQDGAYNTIRKFLQYIQGRITAMGRRCLSCENVVDPKLCNLATLCDSDQICFTEKILNANKEERYRLGCTLRMSCSSFMSTPVGKRQTSVALTLPLNKTYCGRCCDNSENCNRDLCTAGGIAGLNLNFPPLRLQCNDIDNTECGKLIYKNNEYCSLSHPEIKNLLCPRTCGTCTGGGIVIAPSLPAMTPSPVVCPGLYSEERCHHIDCAIGLCNDTDVRFLCQSYCDGQCKNTACTDEQQFYSDR